MLLILLVGLLHSEVIFVKSCNLTALNAMEKISKIAFLLAIVIWSCKAKVDRNNLAFNSSVAEIERNMLLLDSILIHFPEQKKNVIRSYYYEVDSTDTTLFINAEMVGEIHNVDISHIAKQLNLSAQDAQQSLWMHLCCCYETMWVIA
jgi:hypothetical protein